MARVGVYETRVLEGDLDSFGHVNNARYLAFFEQARWDLITNGGYGLEQVREYAKGPVILEANVKFRKELRLRECIRIETRMSELKGRTGTLEQTLYNEAGETSAVAVFVMGFFDLKTRKLVRASSEWLRAIGWDGGVP